MFIRGRGGGHWCPPPRLREPVEGGGRPEYSHCSLGGCFFAKCFKKVSTRIANALNPLNHGAKACFSPALCPFCGFEKMKKPSCPGFASIDIFAANILGWERYDDSAIEQLGGSSRERVRLSKEENPNHRHLFSSRFDGGAVTSANGTSTGANGTSTGTNGASTNANGTSTGTNGASTNANGASTNANGTSTSANGASKGNGKSVKSLKSRV